jgi:hypothetical protein
VVGVNYYKSLITEDSFAKHAMNQIGCKQVSITDTIEALLREEANQLAYWKQQLANLPTLQLPADPPRDPLLTFRNYAFYFISQK